ncbi:MAG: hypothetical protein IJ857_06180 [Lachnospiraceae bacterium]|nr:hypothetical protein [Lachnospiraceae bacterium]
MAKKFGKFLLFSLFAGAAAAGTYYFLKNKETEDSFEDSEPDVNDELEEFLKNESESVPVPAKREYVPLNFSKEEVEDAENAVDEEEAAEKEEAASAGASFQAETEEAPGAGQEISFQGEKEEVSHETAEEENAPYVEKKLEEAAEKVSFEEENIIGKPAEENAVGVEKDPGPKNDRISTFSFSSFEE